MSALDNLTKSLGDAVRKLLRLPLVDEKAVKELVRDLQRALIQSDVNVALVLEISNNVEKRSLEEKLPPGISRSEHVMKVLYEELTKFLGEEPARLTFPAGSTSTLMLVGIQGTGKTTSAVKLAKFYQKRGLKTGVVCADTFRPGAFPQIKQLADSVSIPVYGNQDLKNPESLSLEGIDHFRKQRFDLIIVDTAGRHKNEADLMDEMKRMSEKIQPTEVILAIDGSIGQAAMAQARAFNETAKVGSILVTKLDGTAKGGGALSAVVATGAKIKFLGVGEKVDDLEYFEPSAFVGRILGQGDLKGLVEKVREAQTKIGEKKARAFLKGRFTLKDMYEQMESLRKLGPLKKVWSMLPGGFNIPDDAMDIAEKKVDSWRVIIQSMTREEVEEPKLVDSSRARRIARGSGVSEREVKELLNQYMTMKRMMKTLKRRQPDILRKLPLMR